MKLSVAFGAVVASIVMCVTASADVPHAVGGGPWDRGYDDAQSTLPTREPPKEQVAPLPPAAHQVVRISISVTSISESCVNIYALLHPKLQSNADASRQRARPIPPNIASDAEALKAYRAGWISGCKE